MPGWRGRLLTGAFALSRIQGFKDSRTTTQTTTADSDDFNDDEADDNNAINDDADNDADKDASLADWPCLNATACAISRY